MTDRTDLSEAPTVTPSPAPDAPTAAHDGTPVLELREVGKTYGSGEGAVEAIRSVSFDVRPGEMIAIVGPSGAGKTTLLNCIVGLLPTTKGAVLFEGDTVTEPPEAMAVVFQDYSRSLLPWRSVRNNVELPIRKKHKDRAVVRAKADAALAAVGLAHADRKFPWQLSGGMQQRVAIARALAYEPDILIMDEPFASLDAIVRAELEDLVLRIVREMNMTAMIVTHDIDEAVYLADRIFVLTKSPTEIAEEIAIPLAKPRNQVTTKDDPAFAHLRTRIYSLITEIAAR